MTSQIQRYEGWIEAISPIHHGGNEKTGSSPVLRTIYLWVEGQGEVPIPYISGNSIRGKLRRLFMKEFLETVGIEVEKMDPKIYHTFFTGGVLEGTEETYTVIDLKLRQEIRQTLIPINLFGCALGNQMLPSKMKVGHAFPICKEYSIYLPKNLKNDERVKKPVRVFTDEAFQTRKDDLRVDREEKEQAIQMKVDYECFIPGTKFYHWWLLEYPTELEMSCFGKLIEIFKEYSFLGGSSAVGEGKVQFDYQPAIPSSKAFDKFVKDRKKDIKTLIEKISKL